MLHTCWLEFLMFGFMYVRVSLALLPDSNGPNVCPGSSGYICCPGWKMDEYAKCLIPICTGYCGVGGICIGPNLCLCANGLAQYTCTLTPKNEVKTSERCLKPCENGALCTDGKCDCLPGFSGELCEKKNCIEDCSSRGTCLSSGECFCNHGYTGTFCQEEQKGPCFTNTTSSLCIGLVKDWRTTQEMCCNSIGQAWGEPCQLCSNVNGCGTGFVRRFGNCQPIDYCSIPGLCENGNCVGFTGGFTCNCPTGWKLNAQKTACEKLPDVCHNEPNKCGPGGTCINTESGYKCACKVGYELSTDKKTCKLTISNACQEQGQSRCQNGMCYLEGDSYYCECNAGYIPDFNSKNCLLDNDPCVSLSKNAPPKCEHGYCATRENNKSDFECFCYGDYHVSIDLRACEKDTYCQRYSTLCPNGQCIAVNDFYRCQCNENFQPSSDGLDCVPVQIDPCLSSIAASCTSSGGKCHRTNDNWKCECPDNSQLSADGFSCSPISQNGYSYCREWPQVCGRGSRCQDTMNGEYYKCVCLEGYEPMDESFTECRRSTQTGNYEFMRPKSIPNMQGDSDSSLTSLEQPQETLNRLLSQTSVGSTQGISEINSWITKWNKPGGFCLRFGSSVCRYGWCMDHGQSYQCVCKPGYRLDNTKRKCEDIDECTEIKGLCWMGTCINLSGQHSCYCLEGFQLDESKICVDRNECVENKQLCQFGTCQNEWGTYSCKCSFGYKASQNGKSCDPIVSNAQLGAVAPASVDLQKCPTCSFGCEIQPSSSALECVCGPNQSVVNNEICVPSQTMVGKWTNKRRRRREAVAQMTMDSESTSSMLLMSGTLSQVSQLRRTGRLICNAESTSGLFEKVTCKSSLT